VESSDDDTSEHSQEDEEDDKDDTDLNVLETVNESSANDDNIVSEQKSHPPITNKVTANMTSGKGSIISEQQTQPTQIKALSEQQAQPTLPIEALSEQQQAQPTLQIEALQTPTQTTDSMKDICNTTPAGQQTPTRQSFAIELNELLSHKSATKRKKLKHTKPHHKTSKKKPKSIISEEALAAGEDCQPLEKPDTELSLETGDLARIAIVVSSAGIEDIASTKSGPPPPSYKPVPPPPEDITPVRGKTGPKSPKQSDSPSTLSTVAEQEGDKKFTHTRTPSTGKVPIMTMTSNSQAKLISTAKNKTQSKKQQMLRQPSKKKNSRR